MRKPNISAKITEYSQSVSLQEPGLEGDEFVFKIEDEEEYIIA